MELLRRLCDAPGVSGYEDAVRDILIREAEGRLETKTDHLGNLYASKGEGKTGPKVMLAAHMDEVGLMVERVDDEGFLKINAVGGVDPRVLPGKTVRVGQDALPGVIGSKPMHLEGHEQLKKTLPLSGLRIDIGARTKKEAEGFVEPGCPVWFDTRLEELDGILKAKAFDDRAGCYLLARLARHEYDFPCTFAWTVQEEVGLRGGYIAASKAKPDIFLAVEGTGACDVPTEKDMARNPFLGKGPVITILDSRVACSEKLVELIVDTAEREGIPWQFKRPLIGGTDAGAAVRARALLAAVVAVPCRYIHSPVALAHRQDIINTYDLLATFLGRLKEVKL